jgi:leader peptidase (prepilin peptidase) / N-methyltransferase
MSRAGTPPTAKPDTSAAVGPPQPQPASSLPSPAAGALAGAIAVALAVLAVASRPLGAGAAIAAFVSVVLVVLAAIDIRQRIIPNRIVLPATAIVLAARIISLPHRAPEFVLAAVAAAVVLMLPNLFNRSAMGMGDVKLALLLGAALGWASFTAILVAFLAAGPFAALTLIRGGRSARKASIPLGPFLAFGGLVILLIPRLVGHGGL